MVERRVCTFCGDEIEPGTGRMYIKKDGVVYHFCTSKCFKNMVILGRVPRRTTWTRYYEREKQVRLKGGPVEAAAPKARKIKKPEPEKEAKAEEAKEVAEEKPAEEKKPKTPPAKKTAPKEPEAKTPEKKTSAPKKEKAPKKPSEKEGTE
ncbi:MAG TPA: 50S ribosomal protein L24e [Thermoplasmata archaeon]|nr:50S ribosomal protein L24e [Thermoplasmata archaeon]